MNYKPNTVNIWENYNLEGMKLQYKKCIWYHWSWQSEYFARFFQLELMWTKCLPSTLIVRKKERMSHSQRRRTTERSDTFGEFSSFHSYICNCVSLVNQKHTQLKREKTNRMKTCEKLRHQLCEMCRFNRFNFENETENK